MATLEYKSIYVRETIKLLFIIIIIIIAKEPML